MSNQQASQDKTSQQPKVILQPKPIETTAQQPKAPQGKTQDVTKNSGSQQAPGSQQAKPADTASPSFKPAEVTPNKTVTLPGTVDGAARQENEGGPAAKEAKKA